MKVTTTKKPIKKATQPHKRLPLRAFTTAILLACLCPLPGQAQTEHKILFPNGEYTETTTDMRVAATGGPIKLNRAWTNGRWYINPNWTHLRFITDPLDGSVQAIDRAGGIYTLSGFFTYNLDQAFIQKKGDGWRWYDRKGNWITYDSKGRMTGYGDANDVGAKFILDNEGRRTEVRDTFNQLVYKFEYDKDERLVKASDRNGRTVQYHWNGGLLAKVTDVMGNELEYSYDKNGYLTGRTEPDGSKVEITYLYTPPAPVTAIISGVEYTLPTIDVSNGLIVQPESKIAQVSKFKDKNGAVTLWNVDYNKIKQQYTVKEDDPLGKKTVSVYDNEGKLLTRHINGNLETKISRDGKHIRYQTDDRGLTTVTHYDTQMNPVKITYPDGISVTTEYDYTIDKPVRYTNRQGIATVWQYDKKGNLISQIDAAGQPEQQVTTYQYDGYGQPVAATYGKDEESFTVRFGYDTFGNVIVYTDGESNSHRYSYLIDGNITEYQTPLGKSWQYGYNAAGQLTSITNPLNQTTYYEVDSLGRTIAMTNPLGFVTHWTYYNESDGTIISRTDALGHTHSYHYDLNNNLVKNISTTNERYLFSYDAENRLKTLTDAADNVITLEYGTPGSDFANLPAVTHYPTFKETYQYNRMGQITEVKQHLDDQNASVTQINYNIAGQLLSVTQPGGMTTLYNYDSFGNTISETDAQGNITQQSWDSLNRLSSVTDANGNVHTYHYDKNYNLVKEVMPTGEPLQYDYNEDDQLIRYQDANGNITTYQYNDAGRLTHKIITAANGSEPEQTIDYHYNNVGDLTEVKQSGTTHSHFVYTRDSLGRITQEEITYGTGENAIRKILKYRFDEDSNLTAITYPDNTEATFSREKGFLQQATLPDGKTISWQNYRWTQPTEIQFPGTTQTLSYDALLRPLTIEVKAGNTSLMNRSYAYNTANNISLRSTEDGNFSYLYDRLNRLTQATPPQKLQQKGLPVESYAYDAVGNRIGSSHQPGEWLYGLDNQLIKINTDTQLTVFEYSQNGNIVKEAKPTQIKTYTYDATDRLTQVVTDDTKTSIYQYDPFGRRISKTVNEEITWYLYTVEGLIAELDDQGNIKVAYGWFPDSLWGTHPLWQANIGDSQTLQSADYYYLHTDHLGTPQIATDEQGNVSWKGLSEAFGKTLLDESNRITMNLRFPGQYYDSETNSHYNYFRDYNPALGRYWQKDRIGLAGGINPYIYANNNSLIYIDPKGEWGFAGMIYGGIAGAIGGYITGGWKGAVFGAAGGAFVGLIAPNASGKIGALLGAAEGAAASLAGQAAGNLADGKDVTDWCNYDFWAAAGAGLGGVGARPIKASADKWIDKYRPIILGRPLNKPSLYDTPAKTIGAVAEGAITGGSELGGKHVGDNYRN